MKENPLRVLIMIGLFWAAAVRRLVDERALLLLTDFLKSSLYAPRRSAVGGWQAVAFRDQSGMTTGLIRTHLPFICRVLQRIPHPVFITSRFERVADACQSRKDIQLSCVCVDLLDFGGNWEMAWIWKSIVRVPFGMPAQPSMYWRTTTYALWE